MAYHLVPVERGRSIPLDKPVVFVGRHPECDVVLTNSRKVSRKHCCIAQVDDRYVVRDLGSMNGVCINGKRVQRSAPLAIGDQLSIGDVIYVLQARNGHAAPREEEAPGETLPPQSAEPAPAPRNSPAELSQEFPVAIPDEGVDFAVQSSSNASPGQSTDESDEDLIDDVILVEDEDHEVEEDGSPNDIDDISGLEPPVG